jgi:hypothetical protein
MADKSNISLTKLTVALEEYRLKDKHGKYVHAVPEIALRAGITPHDLVKLAVKRGLKKRVIVQTDSVVMAALSDYVNHPELFTKDIADRYGISTATLTVWATNAGVTLRSRGLHKMDMPTTRQRQILEMAALYSYEKVGEHFGISRSRVSAVVKRWKGWKVPIVPPFKPGDILLWRNKRRKERLIVVDAGLTRGTVKDESGRTLRAFTWSSKGRLPKKIGVDPKYTICDTTGDDAPFG